MKLQFKYQPFQADAAVAVCDVFAGQPFRTTTYRIDLGDTANLQQSFDLTDVGFHNQPLVPELTHARLLDNVKAVQRRSGLEPDSALTGPGINLSIEMETGTGKTYTYVKTMYELNKRFGWSKFIIVVPSVAIREGVYKSLQTTQEHFAAEYGKKIRFFIYNSDDLPEVDHFASDSAINVMIINMQAFNSSKNQRIIDKQLDSFLSHRPIDIIAKTNPILIIDEPQSVEGKQTKESLKKFNPLFTLRYSATHRETYNMIYRLDAMDAYNQHLVKRIAALGITLANLRSKQGVNAMPADRSLYNYVIYDSDNERKFAHELDICDKIAVYVKLPGSFFINTPVGKYNPDWAIAFHEGEVKHVYFIAETKGVTLLDSLELRGVEEAKIACAKAHFAVISSDSVVYDVVDSYDKLMQVVMK